MVIKKVLNVFSTVLTAVAFVLAVILIVSRFLGFQSFTILTGSMEPDYPVGSLIYVKKIDPLDIKKEQVITYKVDSETIVTHRVKEIIPDAADPNAVLFKTRGDANNIEDSNLVHSSTIIGTPIIVVPYVGFVVNFLQNSLGKYLIVFIVLLFLIIFTVSSLISACKNNNRIESCERSDENKPKGRGYEGKRYKKD